MIFDYSVPADCQPSDPAEVAGRPPYRRGRFRREELQHLALELDRRGRPALADLQTEELVTAWSAAVESLLDANSPVRKALDPALTLTARLSGPALQAALEAMLEGTVGEPLDALLDRAAELDRRRSGLVAAVLAANVPALAVQVLLPALALRRPVLLKSSSREPLLGAALVDLLRRHHPALADALAAVTWSRGETDIESGVFATAESVVAYGDDGTLRALTERRKDLLGHGTMTSLAVISADAVSGAASGPTAAGLAADIALFEQRGCLSVEVVYTDGDAAALARSIARELAALARRWPPPPLDLERAAAVRQMRQDAALHGLLVAELPLASGTVIVDPDPAPRPGPGLRSVRVVPLEALDRLGAILAPLAGRLQGVALAGDDALRLEPLLVELQVTRLAPPGMLQRPDAMWANGETHLIERLA